MPRRKYGRLRKAVPPPPPPEKCRLCRMGKPCPTHGKEGAKKAAAAKAREKKPKEEQAKELRPTKSKKKGYKRRFR